ncbi:MAG TPA: hypothetical protein PL063_04330 [Candidatus Cloacimonadota bacterium]|jgi:hypothetical protein|nr:hypothetical protein [Candidatus Cloacimonadales bacterium]HOQ80744.1 hypothetical protein [Candidatus Cloacimonadota bacterium]HPY96417.1 hypothetical protein [Candidatus Cloacimonadota bacterium]HQB41010.1 hypothetical protein [Candidatus Cloacimonadota bacterium]
MVNVLRITLAQILDYYKNDKKSIFFFFFVSIFGAWNGLQFLLFPSHFNAFISESTVTIFIYDMTNNYSFFVPSTVFIFLTLGVIYWFLHINAEIMIINYFKKELNKKERWGLFFNYSIPSFFTHFFILFLVITLILLLLIIYLFLVSFGVKLSFTALSLMWKLFKFIIAAIIFTTFIMNDFVLYYQYKGNSYLSSIKKSYSMIINNAKSFIIYLFCRYLSIGLTIGLLYPLIRLYVLPINSFAKLNMLYHKVYVLRIMQHWHDVLINTSRLTAGVIESIILFAILVSIFYPFNRLLVWNLFDFEKDQTKIENEEDKETENDNVLL